MKYQERECSEKDKKRCTLVSEDAVGTGSEGGHSDQCQGRLQWRVRDRLDCELQVVESSHHEADGASNASHDQPGGHTLFIDAGSLPDWR